MSIESASSVLMRLQDQCKIANDEHAVSAINIALECIKVVENMELKKRGIEVLSK